MASKLTKNFFLLFIIIFLFAGVVSASYIVDKVLTDDFSFTEYSDGELQEFVYSVAPENYPLLSVELQGHGAYEPSFYLYDVTEDKIVYQKKVGYNEKIKYSFVPEAGEKNQAKEYYLIVLSNGKDGSSFDFNYHIEPQNDAELGIDAPKRFTDAKTITVGDYTGNLGGGDEKDYYAFNIQQDETITIQLASTEKERLGFELIESNYMTTISERGGIEGLNRSFTSTRDQKIWLGIEGSTPYTLSIQSDATKETVTETPPPPVPLPPMPPEPTVIKQENKEPKGLSTNQLIILLILVVGSGLFVALFFRAKMIDKMKAKKKEEEKKK